MGLDRVRQAVGKVGSVFKAISCVGEPAVTGGVVVKELAVVAILGAHVVVVAAVKAGEQGTRGLGGAGLDGPALEPCVGGGLQDVVHWALLYVKGWVLMQVFLYSV